MHYQLISQHNAVLATRFLLNLDVSAIQSHYQYNLHDEVLTIRKALVALQKNPQTERSQALLTLTDSANHLAEALSEEACECLTDFIVMNQNP